MTFHPTCNHVQPMCIFLSCNIYNTCYHSVLRITYLFLEDIGKCTKSLDLLFVLDSSESVKFSNWKIIIQFVKELANRFTLHSSRVGIIRYASEAEVALPLTQFNDTQSRDSAIDDIFYKTGGTRTDIALKKASEVFKTEDQRSQVLMLVTDGPTNRLEINKDHFVEGKSINSNNHCTKNEVFH